MVDLSDREKIELWLDAMQPTRRREVAVAMAARAALRVLPLIGRELTSAKRSRDEILATFILPPLRAAALSWVAAKYPAHGDELHTVAFAVAFDAFARTSAEDDAAHHAARATTAAFVTIEAVDAIRAAIDAAATARIAATSATNNLLAVQNILAVPDLLSLGKDDDVVAADTADAAQIDSGHSAAELAGTPLWQNGAPTWATEAWRDLKSALLAAGDDWEVWIDWYEARLAGDGGRPRVEALEIARATIPDEIWKQGPAAVNAEIKRLIELHAPASAVSVAISGVEAKGSVGDLVATIASPLSAEPAHVPPNPAPTPTGWMNSGDDPAVQLAAQTRLRARAALEATSVTQPPLPLFQPPIAGTASLSFGGATPETPLASIPATEPGPILEIGPNGLALTAATQLEDFDREIQPALHQHLQRLCSELLESTRRVGNSHPGLMAVVSEYADLITKPLGSLDVTSLWAVGTGLLANREAFARLPQIGGMTEALEPAHLALLQQVAEIHGAFILGFARGRELTDRADHSRLTPEILAAIVPAARDLLERWRSAATMVEEQTRNFFAAIADGAIGPSWQTARLGYSIYIVTRNSLIAVGRLALGANSVFATVGGNILLSHLDPGLVQTQLWLQFMLDQSQTILSFSEPFPELKIWLGSVIDALERDQAFRKK